MDADVAGLEFALVESDGGAVFRLENQAKRLRRAADLPGLSRTSIVQHLVLDRGAKLDDWTAREPNTLRVLVTAPVWGARTERTVSAVVPSPPTAMTTRADVGEHR